MIVVVDYGMGNLGSVLNMFRRIGIVAELSSDPNKIAKAARIILPGVGAFDRGMESIAALNLRDVLDQKVLKERVPTLGICLGMQLMGRSSEEGREPGLGWFDARSIRFNFEQSAGNAPVKIPNMGWNYVTPAKDHPLTRSMAADTRFYFVHSYHVVCARPQDVLLESHYGGIRFTSAIARDNIVGVQFHPEKSHLFGIALLQAFASWVHEPETTAAA